MANTVSGSDLVKEAEKFLGDKYVYGATGPSTFDCSGLMQYVYNALGISIPRTSEEQYAATTRIKKSDLQPGDLVFSEMGSNGPGHVGMYIGTLNVNPSTGQRLGSEVPFVIEAPHTGDVVKYQALDIFNPVAYGRVKNVTDAGGGISIPGLGSVIGGVEGALKGLISFPSQITDYAAKATEDSTKALGWFSAFFQPTTYVRLGAGLLGTILLIAGLYSLYLVESE